MNEAVVYKFVLFVFPPLICLNYKEITQDPETWFSLKIQLESFKNIFNPS